MKLIALGDNCVDVYRNKGEVHPGGNAVNVAVHAARCGAESEYIGNLADDEYAAHLINALKKNRVRYDRCSVIKDSKTKQCVYEVTDGERSFIEVVTGDAWAGPVTVSEDLMQVLSQADVIVSSCNAKIPEQLPAVEELPPVFVFDFGEKGKYRTPEYCDTVCRKIDLAMFSCSRMTDDEFAEFVRPFHEHGIIHVLATMGSAGQIISNGSMILRKQIQQVVPHDTMGAGDSFLAGFVCELQKSGWRKGKRMPSETLENALLAGQNISRMNVLSPGGFGD
jgi:sugar/nucleoside kinase (ribokinase family)